MKWAFKFMSRKLNKLTTAYLKREKKQTNNITQQNINN